MKYFLLITGVAFFFIGCSGLEKSEKQRMRSLNAKAEDIYRIEGENFFSIETPKKRKREPYSFEKNIVGGHPRITKEYFRCKGNQTNPPITLNKGSKNAQAHFDCGGYDSHSLPVKNEKEFIYPIMIELLNYIQEKTEKKIVITCGHRCPAHNLYADTSRKNQSSKHLIGAEVDFYVTGLEYSPYEIVEIIKDYYKEHAQERAYKEFSKYRSDGEGTAIYNKEVFVRVYDKHEGRDLDNAHKYPYVNLQVRYDKEGRTRVLYSWHKAFNGFMRW